MASASKAKPKAKSERVTLYVKPEHRGLLAWAREYTQARSLSEAVFAALADLKARVKARQLQALEETHGIWEDDSQVEGALEELEKGWRTWLDSLEHKGS